jgi:hypothetical protein
MTLVAGRAGHRRAKIRATANPAYALVARRNGITIVAGRTIGTGRIATPTRRRVAGTGVVTLVTGRAGHTRA